MSRPETSRHPVRPAFAAVIALGLQGLVLLWAQADRDLMTMDDLREAEIAREMAADGNFVVPHLAGLPFAEKPPGFQAVVAAVFRLPGGPSVLAGRLVAAGFAALALWGAFLWGRRAAGAAGGVIASSLLGFSPLFLRVSHEILLDNALLACLVFAFGFTWTALWETDLDRKRGAYVRAALLAGLSFLVKGLTGPALLAAGYLLFLVSSGRWAELRSALGPRPVVAFITPVLAWLIPFLVTAPPGVAGEFFIRNHFGRFYSAYASHSRPAYFYLQTIGYKFAPGALLLPFAAWSAWRRRKTEDGGRALALLSFAAGPLLLLSLSSAKDAIYLLPVYPAFSVLAARWCCERPSPIVRIGLAVAGTAAATGAILATAVLGGPASAIVPALIVILILAVTVAARDETAAWTSSAVLWAIACLLCLSGPIADHEEERKQWRPTIFAILRASGDRDLALYRPDDELRGACGFYRNRTARELNDPSVFTSELAAHEDMFGIVWTGGDSLPGELLLAASRRGLDLREVRRVPYYGKSLVLVSPAKPVTGRAGSNPPSGSPSPGSWSSP